MKVECTIKEIKKEIVEKENIIKTSIILNYLNYINIEGKEYGIAVGEKLIIKALELDREFDVEDKFLDIIMEAKKKSSKLNMEFDEEYKVKSITWK